MPQLIFPIIPDGLCVDALINLDATTLLPLRARGTGPSPIQARALIDTGSDVSAVALSILQRLAVPVSQQAFTRGVAGSMPVQLHRVSFHLLDLSDTKGPWLTLPSLLVMGLPDPLPFDVLVGLDVLLTCRMLVDGPRRLFTLDF